MCSAQNPAPQQSATTLAFREGYADAQANRPMAIRWGTGGRVGHRYGMGYFHGRAHSQSA